MQDNLNTHAEALLHEAFPPVQARRLAEHFKWHHTSKQGRWLNMAGRDRRALSKETLNSVTLVPLATCSPELNPVERVCLYL